MEKIVTIKYVFGTLKQARIQGIDTDYLFYLQLKQDITSSVIKVGRGYLKKLSEQLDLSETSISTRVNSLVKKGFACKVYDQNEKVVAIKLLSYYKVYTGVFNLSDEIHPITKQPSDLSIAVRTIKYKMRRFKTRNKLKEFLDTCEIVRLCQLVNNKEIQSEGLKKSKLTKFDLQSTEMVPLEKDTFKKNTPKKNPIYNKINISYWAMANHIGIRRHVAEKRREINKLRAEKKLTEKKTPSLSYVFKLMSKLVLNGVLVKEENKGLIPSEQIPGGLEEVNRYRLGIQDEDDSMFYCKSKGVYYKQSVNSYFFIFRRVFSNQRSLHENIFITLKQTLLNKFGIFVNTQSLLSPLQKIS